VGKFRKSIICSHAYEVRAKSFGRGHVERKPVVLQLCAARYHWIDVLWINVSSVASQAPCFCATDF